jgi:hypothetical protein
VDAISKLMDFYLQAKKYQSSFSQPSINSESDDMTSFVCTKGQIIQLFNVVQQRPACQLINFTRAGHVGKLVILDMWST